MLYTLEKQYNIHGNKILQKSYSIKKSEFLLIPGPTQGIIKTYSVNSKVKDTIINAVTYTRKFAFKDSKGTDLGTSPTHSDIHGVELTFYLLRGESFYSYTTYAAIDKGQLDI